MMSSLWVAGQEGRPRPSRRHPSAVPATEVQAVLLDHGCYLLPFLDLKPGEPGFRALQERGVRGEVRGTGRSRPTCKLAICMTGTVSILE